MVLAAVVEEGAGSGLRLLQPDFLDLLWGGIGMLLLLGIAVVIVVVVVKAAQSSSRAAALDARLNKLAERVRALEDQYAVGEGRVDAP